MLRGRWRWMDMRGEMRARRAAEVRGAYMEAAVPDRLSLVACGECFTRIGTLLAFGDARVFGAQSTHTKRAGIDVRRDALDAVGHGREARGVVVSSP